MRKAWLVGLAVTACLAFAPVAHAAEGDEPFDKGGGTTAKLAVPANLKELQKIVGVEPTEKKADVVTPAAPIRAQGMVLDVAGEAMQIAGKIVVDKATAEALRIVRAQLERALSCPTTQVFTRTCEVVARLRMADLVSSPDALLQALAQDLMAQLAGDLEQLELYASLARDVWPSLLRVRNLDARELGVLIVQRIRDRGAEALGKLNDQVVKDPAQRLPIALALASASIASCLEANVNARACPAAEWISRTARQLGVEQPEVVAAAQTVATRALVVLVGAQKSQGGPRAVSAGIELAFDVLCLSVDFDHGCEGAEVAPAGSDAKKTPAPAAPEAAKPPTQPAAAAKPTTQPATSAAKSAPSGAKARLRIARAALLALVEDEPLRVVVAFGDFLELGGPKLGGSTQRGLRLLGAVLDYARTYASGTDKDDSALHEQRTQIIRALSDDLTDRTDRGKEWIWSIGGALRVIATEQQVEKPDGTDRELKGVIVPVSLPLGIGLDYLGDGGDMGLHLELSGIDLGRYAEIQSGTVHRPDVLSAVNVSLAIGFFYGASMPWYVGGVVGYSPAISQGKLGEAGSETTPERGFYFGLTTGVYVPLFDLD